MSVVINGTGSISGLSNVGGIASAQSGSVIQTVTSTSTSSVSTTSASLVTTGISASITPQFSTSKILIFVNTNGYLQNAAVGSFTVYRGSTNLSTGTSISAQNTIYSPSGALVSPIAMSFLDSPATTSSTTYTIYFCVSSGITLNVNYPGGLQSSNLCSFTLMEIAA